MARSDLRAKIRLEGDASGATKAIKQTESGFKRLGSRIRSGAIALTAALASTAGAIKLLGDAGARLGQQRSLERALESQGASIDKFLGELRSLSNQQIATSDLILASNRALALGISKDDIPGLLEAATKASVALGISATTAFNDITTGVGRASPLILDNLGIVVDAVKIYAAYAAEIGVSSEELTKQQKTLALSAAVMENAGKGAEDFADAQSKVTVALDKGKTALKEWFEQAANNIAQSDTLASAIDGTATALSDYSAALRGVTDALKGLVPDQDKANESFITFDRLAKTLPPGLQSLNQALRDYGKSVKDTEAAQEKLNEGLKNSEEAYNSARSGVEGLTQAQIDAEARTKRIEEGLLAEATALDTLRDAIGEVTQAELQKKLGDITAALEAARIETGGNTAAFLEMESKVTPAIDHMRNRIEVLARTGRDLGEMADATGEQIDDLGETLEATALSTDKAAVATRGSTAALSASAAQARVTAGEYVRLSAVAETLALAQARTALRQTQRARGVRGSSGSSGIGDFGLSPFGTGGKVKVNADGILEPA